MANVDNGEIVLGDLIDLSTVISPRVAKTWYVLANWCYKWGRKSADKIELNLGKANPSSHDMLFEFLPAHTSAEEKSFIASIFSRSLSSIRLPNVVCNKIDRKEEAVPISRDLFEVEARRLLLDNCKSLTVECVDKVLTIWHNMVEKVYYFHRIACKSYFTYLNLNSQVHNQHLN